MTARVTLTVVFALTSAALFGIGNVLEHREARQLPAEKALRLGLLAALARRRLWLLGMVGDVGAYVFQALALSIGSLVFVQPMLVCGLVFSLPLSAWVNRHPFRRIDWASSLVLATGLAIFLVDARPGGGIDQAPLSRWVVVGPAFGGLIVVCLVGAVRVSGAWRGLLFGIAAGATFGVTSALTKVFVHELGAGIPSMLLHWEPYALAVLMLVGLLALNSAYQVGSLNISLPAVEAGEPIVATIIGIVLLDERVDVPLLADKVLIALAISAMVVGIIALARSEAAIKRATERTGAGLTGPAAPARG